MATFNITTTVNIDSITSKTGGDIYNINGGYLLIDQDSRVGLNQTINTTLGNITLSPTLGGKCEINSTLVRLIPFNSGLGNVPNFNTTISQESASGLLIGVYQTLNTKSVNSGEPMPISGWLKIKQWNSSNFSVGSLSGVSAIASSIDVAGWLEIVGDELSQITVNRLNSFTISGEYFIIGVSDGNRETTYQIPSSGNLQYHAGVEVETGIGTGVYEFYHNAGNVPALSSALATDQLRGKECWISSDGLLRFGSDGTNSSGGYIVPPGLNIRIGNIFVTNSLAASRDLNTSPNIASSLRYKFNTIGGGVINIDKCSAAWGMIMTQAFILNISNTGVCTNITITEIASYMYISNVNVGAISSLVFTCFTLNNCFAGGTISNCGFYRISQIASGAYVSIINDIDGFTFNNTIFKCGAKAINSTTGSALITRVSNTTFNNTTLGGGRAYILACINFKFKDTVYYDHPSLNTTSSIPMFVFDLGGSCFDCTFDGLSFGGLYMTQAYNGILNLSPAGNTKIRLRNIGSYENPLSLGSPRVDDVLWSRNNTVATVASVNHGFLVGDNIYTVISSDILAIIVGSKTITSVPDVDSFQFTSVNNGSISGTISYFGTKSGVVFSLLSGSASRDVRIQRVYAPHTRSNLYNSDNTSKDVIMENVFSDYLNAPFLSMLNGYTKGVSGTSALTAQVGVYGTHWFNGYVLDVANTTTSNTYTRSSSAVTITSEGHSLRTGMLISVNPITAPTTFTSPQYAVTVLSSSKFNITTSNGGPSSGTVSFRVANGRIGIVMNEASIDTLDRYTIDSGTPLFTSAGGLFMPTIGDQVTYQTPNYLLGQGSTFPIFEPVMGGSPLSRYDITYAIDKNNGLGYSSFENLYYERTVTLGISGQFTVNVTDATGINLNNYVWGTGISPGARVININTNTITLSAANISTVSSIIRFGNLSSEEGLNSMVGFKMKWRIRTKTTNTTPISSLYIQTESTIDDRTAQYPLDTVTLNLTGLSIGSDIVILLSSTQGELLNIDSNASTSYNYVYENAELVDICVFKAGYIPLAIRNYQLGTSNASLPITQIVDRNYA